MTLRGWNPTVERFNGFVREGRDLEFHRGETVYDKFYTRTRLYGKWEESATSHGNLGTLEKPPFYCLELKTSSVGTKGGAMTNEKWQVLREDGSVIKGLLCRGQLLGGDHRAHNRGGGLHSGSGHDRSLYRGQGCRAGLEASGAKGRTRACPSTKTSGTWSAMYW